jgi:hypothetical protein
MTTDDIAERFERETALHEMTVLHDDGLYRHLRFAGPKNSEFWYDLITVPHALIFRGDGESFVFSRLPDMFEFFRSTSGRINLDYWSEKLTSDRNAATTYSPDLFERLVKAEFVNVVRSGDWPRGLGKAIREEILDSDLWEDESGARHLLSEFEFGAAVRASCTCGKFIEARVENWLDADTWKRRHESTHGASHCVTVNRRDGVTFDHAWEWRLREYHWWFTWACHGIVAGIRRYDLHRAIPATVGGAT